MNKVIKLILGILLLLNCNVFLAQNNSKKEKHRKLLNEEITQSCAVTAASEKLLKMAAYLESIGYSYSSTLEKDFLTFDYQDYSINKYNIVESITYKDCKYIELYFKKKKPLKGNYYPKFRMLEFCFDSTEKASEYSKKITHILNNQFKNYGYILQNHDRLIYVQTGVNMYGFIINDMKKDFEKILKTK
jgi:hypothetical protein